MSEWGNGMRNVSRDHPCFCGNGLPGEDMQCSWGVNEHGHIIYGCCKSAQAKAAQKGLSGDVAVGIDGERYVCYAASKSGYMRFWMKESDKKAEKEEWLTQQRALHPEKFGPARGEKDRFAARKRMFAENGTKYLGQVVTDRYVAAAGIVNELRARMRTKRDGTVDEKIYGIYADLCRCVFERPLAKEDTDVTAIMEMIGNVSDNRAGKVRELGIQLVEAMSDDPAEEEYYRNYVLLSLLLESSFVDDAKFTEKEFSDVRDAVLGSTDSISGVIAWRSASIASEADLAKAGNAEAEEQYMAPPEVRDRAYRAFLSELHYEPRHLENRLSEGWTAEEIELAGLRTMPIPAGIEAKYGKRNRVQDPDPKKICRSIISRLGMDALKGVPGFYTDRDGQWTFRSVSGEVLPMYDADGYVIQLRIRLDYFDVDLPFAEGSDDKRAFLLQNDRRYELTVRGFRDVTDGKPVKVDSSFFGRAGKTRSFTSYLQSKEAGRNLLTNGTRAQDEPSVYHRKGDDDTFFWITEGERKAALCSLRNRQTCISIPGVGKYILPDKRGYIDKLRERGAVGVIVAFDADRVSNPNVKGFEEKLISHLEEKGLLVQVAVWNESEGKGIDDLYLAGGSPDIVFSDEYLEKGLEYFLERRQKSCI